MTKNVTYTAKWEKLYTVTYTDGAKGKAFKDQVYSDLESGTDTPKFDGKPTRKGYTFTGWSPKVTDTVTKDVTYVAQWKSVKNGKDNIRHGSWQRAALLLLRRGCCKRLRPQEKTFLKYAREATDFRRLPFFAPITRLPPLRH